MAPLDPSFSMGTTTEPEAVAHFPNLVILDGSTHLAQRRDALLHDGGRRNPVLLSGHDKCGGLMGGMRQMTGVSHHDSGCFWEFFTTVMSGAVRPDRRCHCGAGGVPPERVPNRAHRERSD